MEAQDNANDNNSTVPPALPSTPEKVTITKLSHEFDSRSAMFLHAMNDTVERVLRRASEKMAEIDNVMHFVIYTMEALEQVEFHGFFKKQLLVDVMSQVINAMVISHEQKQQLRETLLPALDNIADVIVAAAKGYLALKTTVEKIDEVNQRCCGGRRHRSAPRAEETVNPESIDIDALINKCYDEVKVMIRHRQLTVQNIVTIGSIAMQVVEEYPQLLGYQKKRIVIQIVHRLIDETQASDDTKVLLHTAVDTTVSAAIDFIVSASKGEIPIVNQVVEAFQDCCAARRQARQ